jgi:succinate dehydrogenase / fumarate reductase flavoprotein subunit
MERYAPNAKDLASRDVVSRAMTIEINEGRGVGPLKDHILLQLSHLSKETLEERLPGISETAKIFAGVDVTKDPVPVIPTVHYNMGGIPTNWKGQVMSPVDTDPHRVVPGLWAAGEAACSSVHGANRLGANSLLDIVVFGRACAEHIMEGYGKHEPLAEVDEVALEADMTRYHSWKERDGSKTVADVRLAMQKIMQQHGGVFRNDVLLQEGVEKLDALVAEWSHIGIQDKSDCFNTEFIEMLELENLLQNSRITLHSANFRKESRGAHSHDDYPERNDQDWLVHTIAHWQKDDSIQLSTREVIQETLNEEVEPVPLAKRTY